MGFVFSSCCFSCLDLFQTGNWNQIKTASGSLRSSVQLKDKWRQLSLAQILRVANIHQLSYSGRKIP